MWCRVCLCTRKIERENRLVVGVSYFFLNPLSSSQLRSPPPYQFCQNQKIERTKKKKKSWLVILKTLSHISTIGPIIHGATYSWWITAASWTLTVNPGPCHLSQLVTRFFLIVMQRVCEVAERRRGEAENLFVFFFCCLWHSIDQSTTLAITYTLGIILISPRSFGSTSVRPVSRHITWHVQPKLNKFRREIVFFSFSFFLLVQQF